MDTTPLLPCPFCGNPVEIAGDRIRCDTSGCILKFVVNIWLDRDRWNKRASLADDPLAVERAAKALAIAGGLENPRLNVLRAEAIAAIRAAEGGTTESEVGEDLRAWVTDLSNMMTVRCGVPGEAIASILDENQRVIEATGNTIGAAKKALLRLVRERPAKG